nr:hypothetical protein [Tanacetum cinerariifolium]
SSLDNTTLEDDKVIGFFDGLPSSLATTTTSSDGRSSSNVPPAIVSMTNVDISTTRPHLPNRDLNNSDLLQTQALFSKPSPHLTELTPLCGSRRPRLYRPSASILVFGQIVAKNVRHIEDLMLIWRRPDNG